MTGQKLFVLPYDGIAPQLASAPVYTGAHASVLGRATIGRDAWLGVHSVIRADGHDVTIGNQFRLGARATVHIAHDVFPTHIGNGVTAGANSIIHACDVGDRCHIGRDVIILDGSKVPDDVALADGAIVFPRSILESGWVYQGQPAKPVRRLEPGELDALHARSHREPDEMAGSLQLNGSIDTAGPLFRAATASTSGRIVAGADVGIWFSCDLDAGRHEISVGERTNIQDNTVIRCVEQPVTIGWESTIGHNVRMNDCVVGSRSLVGMGAILAEGTVVEDDVLLAAGAHTIKGQRIASGWLYGGDPAKKLSLLDDRKRGVIAAIWPMYCMYARKFDDQQREQHSQGN
ncbi:gamma carbonic anhydrase family protein [Allomesorhizobium camelthorni]|uniref:Gamma carbonic anhydrase family protein n=1 Tax=Allomesorhizobium camelthorni TaxID=475069 RepID=A0A6G4WHN1_9HYPH|nr:gamma carbonic anhydrase family protein [Mesorhizobium camelthorni]NGO53726.1 gamma carbonic anhydrase family protein [Mesorhizobium camelthorni]